MRSNRIGQDNHPGSPRRYVSAEDSIAQRSVPGKFVGSYPRHSTDHLAGGWWARRAPTGSTMREVSAEDDGSSAEGGRNRNLLMHLREYNVGDVKIARGRSDRERETSLLSVRVAHVAVIRNARYHHAGGYFRLHVVPSVSMTEKYVDFLGVLCFGDLRETMREPACADL
eukprot:2679435-Rhodomonas_salina.4